MPAAHPTVQLPSFPASASRYALCLFFGLCTVCGSTALAQKAPEKPGKGPAYTTPPAKDLNYPLMGEFVGEITEGGEAAKKRTLALQIRPIAGNRFNAMAFYGGLPGTEGHKAEEMRLIGQRFENSVVLSGGPWPIFVDSDGCNILAPTGQLLGRLERVHRVSPTLGVAPPEEAIVLFDGTNVDSFVNAEMTGEGLLKQGALISPMFQDFNLHVEFRLPYMPLAEGQQRGNSGLYLQSRYECQVLDSFGTERMFNGLGALYRMKAPDVNMALPPLVWQTYDVQFTAPRWATKDKKIRNAHITSWVNGVKVQDNVALPNKTGAGQQEAPTLLPINIQDHGDPVRFRNVWIIDRGLSTAEFPIKATAQQREKAAELEWNKPPEDAKKPAAQKPQAENAPKGDSKPADKEKPASKEDQKAEPESPAGGEDKQADEKKP